MVKSKELNSKKRERHPSHLSFQAFPRYIHFHFHLQLLCRRRTAKSMAQLAEGIQCGTCRCTATATVGHTGPSTAVAHKRYDRKPVMARKQHTKHMSGRARLRAEEVLLLAITVAKWFIHFIHMHDPHKVINI